MIQKVLILGSGALKIGEAGEFDYSGSQAIKALKEEGVKTVLVNPNIATIQTSRFLADKVYFLPVTDFFVEKIIEKEKPDGILLSFGGQTALNCGIALYKRGVLQKNHLSILGTPMSAIILTEDRNKFANHLKKIGIPVPQSSVAKTTAEALAIAKKIGFPLMIRAGFALGGQGSGVARNEKQLIDIVSHAFSFVPHVLVEKYLHHFKEVEYEVVRDTFDNCITVCNMENLDPLGIHTGESMVVAPSQTLTNFEYQHLRSVAIKIIRSLKIVGECNIQFAINPKFEYRNPKQYQNSNDRNAKQKDSGQARMTSFWQAKRVQNLFRASDLGFRASRLDFYVIEVNARLSRSSALASKATGYPLAYVAAKLALGKNLTEIKNKVTQVTQACFEPALDYVVVKIPRWDMEKFRGANEKIGSSMKSVGEVMGIGRTFEEALQKAVRMLDLDLEGVTDNHLLKQNGQSLETSLKIPTPKRLFVIAEAIKKNIPIEKIYSLTGIDPWFLYRIKNIVEEEKALISCHSKQCHSGDPALAGDSRIRFWTSQNDGMGKQVQSNKVNLNRVTLLRLKQLGFSDKRIGQLVGKKGLAIRALRKKYRLLPSVFQIDTLAGEFAAKTNYLYLTYNGRHHDISPLKKEGVIVLGSGPYRIGSSVEFDWTSVSTVMALKDQRKKSIIINCNPETVSTDYDISERLYFEELTFERIADIYEFENPHGIIISVGGQTPNNRAASLKSYGFQVLGTDPKDIDRAEDRSKFSALLDKLSIDQPAWSQFTNLADALKFGEKVGYPIIIRPSYVLSGSAMNICYDKKELQGYLLKASHISQEYPVTISKFFEEAKEIEIDAVAAKGKIKAAVVSEHVEDAGVHSGDATIVLPAQKVYLQTQRKIKAIADKLARALSINGPFNIQFLARDNEVYVIEINLRSSRTFPFISKVTGIDLIQLSVDAFFGKKIKEKPINNGLNYVAVKVSQFSFARLDGADPVLNVEMTSTGEVACFGEDVEEALLKGELAVGGRIPQKGIFVSLGGEENKARFLNSLSYLLRLRLPIYATEKTAQFLNSHGVKTKMLHKVHEKKSPNLLTFFQKGEIDLAINITDHHVKKEINDDYVIRRAAVDQNIPLFTNRKKAALFLKALVEKKIEKLSIEAWDKYLR